MLSSGRDRQMEEEEQLVHLDQPAASQALGGRRLTISLCACALCALAAWFSSPSWAARSTALWKHSLIALHGSGSGMTKTKKYDWKDSNMAQFGSDKENKVLKEYAAKSHEWDEAGQKPGLEVWRINKFKVERMPQEDNGKFFSGDSYIVLNTYQEQAQGEELLYDLHFWIGKYSTQDEYGTAAHKAVELDTVLDDKPVMHRENQGIESKLFKSYFASIEVRKGGVASGFITPEPVKDSPQMFRVEEAIMKAVPAKLESLDDEHTFVFDAVTAMYLIEGSAASKSDLWKASQLIQDLQNGHTKRVPVEHVDGASLTDVLKKALKDADEKK